jgi:hypothetical protein
MPQLTNATKAQIIVAVNAILALVTSFGLDLSADQIGAILAAVNALASLWIGLTYRQSPKRVPDA